MCVMASLADIVAIAQDALESFGADAPALIAERVREHRRHGDPAGAEMWRKVEIAARELSRGSDATNVPPARSRATTGPRSILQTPATPAAPTSAGTPC